MALCYLKSQHSYIYAETNEELSRKSGIFLKICFPSTRVAYSKMCPIKWFTRLKQPHFREAGRRGLRQFQCL